MGLRIAFDLDGTVADMYEALHKEALGLFGEEVLAKARYRAAPPAASGVADEATPKPEDATRNLAMEELHLTARQQMQLWDHVRKIENFWTTLPELEPGIIARIAKLADERRWDVIFLTTRPATSGDTTQLQSQRWLDAHGFRYPSVYVVQRSRGKIAEALQLDMVVDDRAENCLDVAVESKAKAVLVWHGSLADVPTGARRLGVRAVASIAEALALAEQYDELRKQPRVIRSIRKMMGKE